METERTKGWPKGEMYLVQYGDRFGVADCCLSAIGDFMCAAVWRRDPSAYFGIAPEINRQYLSQAEAMVTADKAHPAADGMGEMETYRCPAKIAHDLGWC